MYSAASGADRDTLFQLRNLINRRNVRKDLSQDVHASQDIFMTVVESHILCAAMDVFQMSTLNDNPTSVFFPEGSKELEPCQQLDVLLRAVREIVDRHVDISFAHILEQTTSAQSVDTIYEYSSDVLSLELLFMEFVDAIREGDGSRILRCWRYFLPIFRASNSTNYSIEAFTLLAQEKFLLSPRMAFQLKWTRTVNTHGRPGKNIPCDLHMEHLNRDVKASLCDLGSNVTDLSVQLIGRCIGKIYPILHQFDVVNNIPVQSGGNSHRSSQADLDRIIKQPFTTSQVFHKQAGRSHRIVTFQLSKVTSCGKFLYLI